MILGFTGTQKDVTGKQFDAMLTLVTELRPTEIHHGDCVGADHRFHQLCEWLNSMNPNYQIEIHIHPPTNESKRKFCVGDVEHPPKDYIVRNHDIVDASDVVIACPPTVEELQRSGTWSTWRYANKMNKKVYLIIPSGEIT